MVGIGQDDFGVEVVLEHFGRQRLDRTVGADGHEGRGLDDAVGRVQKAGAGARVRALGDDFEPRDV